ncbi:twin-arginine translocase TatA/TatE family subunit [Georgenia wutianyii]|uniref:Sec-independent protein translocase protein TatA n=1 Tax=Georgenia wutianyii TaxID=2585135 RepID=A0ABX5VL50_9MICO|nr:Sec-independent protein translocase subunit TatA [Georgenia wutianyii]QDB79197.1 twin-arginine translocase TatA/TatE family subunit [Georgenia wutianyii]
MRLQFWHIVVLVLLIVILFGAKRLPDVASSVGKSLKIFKKEVTDLTREDDVPAGTTTTTTPAGTTTTTPTPVETTVRDEMRPEFRPGGDPGIAPTPPGGPVSDQR